jgi:hypothetical protein
MPSPVIGCGLYLKAPALLRLPRRQEPAPQIAFWRLYAVDLEIESASPQRFDLDAAEANGARDGAACFCFTR